jgi:thioesterase domain-containing protein
VDHQVKVNGFRIELGEIEAGLLEHRDITQAAVTVHGSGANAELAAYVIPEHGRPVSAHEVRAFLANSLPEYMVPATVTALKVFPLTPNGKLDRKALPEPARERSSARALVLPRTPLEQRLADIWERELDIRPVGVRDNFFDLGVRSIVAGTMFAAIERELGNRLPLGAIFRAPTIESLAELLEAEQHETRWTSLVPIQPEGSGPPLFCVHGAAGTIFHLEPLARHLGHEQPFYGLQARGLYGDVPPLTTVPQMASHYISEIRQVCPHGPYRLAGAFFGATVAFEMARQFVSQSESVELLASFNGPSPIWTREYGWFGNQPGYQARRPTAVPLTGKQRVRVAIRDPRRVGTALARRSKRLANRASATYRKNVTTKIAIALDRPLPERLREEFFCDIHVRAQGDYEPPTYDGSMLTFYGEGLYDDPDLGWSPLVKGGVHSYGVPGVNRNNMHAIVEPNVAFVADCLRQYLSPGDGAAR